MVLVDECLQKSVVNSAGEEERRNSLRIIEGRGWVREEAFHVKFPMD